MNKAVTVAAPTKKANKQLVIRLGCCILGSVGGGDEFFVGTFCP